MQAHLICGAHRGIQRAEAGGKARVRVPIGGGAQDPHGSRWTLLESPQRGLPRFFMHRGEGGRRSFLKKSFLRFALSLFFNSYATSAKG